VTVAGRSLDRLRDAFTAVGLAPEYGGAHSNGLTHMALVGFADGSYLELISTLDPGVRAPWWPDHIAGDAGPCGWCARAPNLAAECERLRAAGIAPRGPRSYHRDRPDGTRVEWDLAFPDDGPPGAVLPFLIEDRTPRELRVRPTAALAGSELTGVATVVIGVRDAAWTVALFEQVYGWTHRETRLDPVFGATVVQFRDGPVALASPRADGEWLARRLERFGEGPAAVLLGSRDLEHSARRFPAAPGTWMGRPALWLDPDRLAGTRVGIIKS
jgi:hypothetical protein